MVHITLTICLVEASVDMEPLHSNEGWAVTSRANRQSRIGLLMTDFGIGFALGVVMVVVTGTRNPQFSWRAALSFALVTGLLSALFGRRFWRLWGSRKRNWLSKPEKPRVRKRARENAPGKE